MESILPVHSGYDSCFVISLRKHSELEGKSEQVGVVIVKRTYEIDPVQQTMAPQQDEKKKLKIFMQDKPANWIRDTGWIPEQGVSLERIDVPDWGEALRVAGVANGKIIQSMDQELPLAGRAFTLSFLARIQSDLTTNAAVVVELESSGSIICAITAEINNEWSYLQATGVWSDELASTQCTVVLRMANDATVIVDYLHVQVEQRQYPTSWDSGSILHYEHDLAAFKPECDVIVLGRAPTSDSVTVQVVVDELQWLSRQGVEGPTDRFALGWESRANEERKQQAGDFSPDPERYPYPPSTLPVDFDNRYFNGYLRHAKQREMPYLPPQAKIIVRRGDSSGNDDYSFSLRGDQVVANYYYYRHGLDERQNWHSESVTMNVDTLVVEPEDNRCYLVWRGTWPIERHDVGRYRLLEVTATT